MLLVQKIINPFEDETYNFSESNFPADKKWINLPDWEIAIKIATFIPIIILGIIGNVIILNIIVRNRALRTPTNLLIANMASADLLTIIFCPIMFMFHDFYQNYQLGPFGCKIEGFLDGALLITAVFNLCAISYDRLTAIVLPTEARLTIPGAKIVMALTWIAGILISAPLAIYRTHVERQWKDFLETYCKENTTILPKYWHVLIAALVWFPLGIMILSYSAIFHKLDRYEKHVLKREHPLCVSYKTKVAKTLFMVVLTFVILRLPFTVLVFLRNEKLLKNTGTDLGQSFEALWYASHYLIFLNAAVNPIIYGLNNDNFRRAFNQTPIFRGWYNKPKLKKQKIRKPSTYGNLQCPDGGEEKNSGWKSLFSSKENKFQLGACYGTKSTKTTQVRQFSKIAAMDNSIGEPKPESYAKISLDGNCDKVVDSINSNGFI